MNDITLEYLQEKIAKRYFDRLPHKTLSKSELIERLKSIDYEQLSRVIQEEVSDHQEIEEYSKMGEMYISTCPDFPTPTYEERFTKDECIEMVRDFFSKESPELEKEFMKFLQTAVLKENERNVFSNGVVHVNLKEKGNTIKELFGLMHEFTHSLKYPLNGSRNHYYPKIAEVPTLLNELYFLDYIISLNNPEISKEALNYICYKINDNKYEAMSSLIGNDLAKIYRIKGKIDFESMQEYVEQLDLTSLKGLYFLQIGDQFLNAKIEGKTNPFWYMGGYILAELIAAKLYHTKDYSKRLSELLEVIGTKEENLTPEFINKLHDLGIVYMDANGKISLTAEDLENLKGHLLILLEYLNALKLKIEEDLTTQKEEQIQK